MILHGTISELGHGRADVAVKFALNMRHVVAKSKAKCNKSFRRRRWNGNFQRIAHIECSGEASDPCWYHAIHAAGTVASNVWTHLERIVYVCWEPMRQMDRKFAQPEVQICNSTVKNYVTCNSILKPFAIECKRQQTLHSRRALRYRMPFWGLRTGYEIAVMPIICTTKCRGNVAFCCSGSCELPDL